MISPYQSSGQGQYYGSPNGLAYLLERRNQDTQAALANIGSFAGALGAGVGGVMRGRANPEVFGAGTTPGTAGARAGLMNFASAYGGGNGGGAGQTGFAGLKQSGGGTGAGMNFKQLAELGKSADAFRSAMIQGQPTVGDEQPNVFGTDEEWKTLGAQEKFQRVQTAVQANAEKSVMQRMAMIGQQMQMQQASMDADQAFGSVMSRAQGRINNAALAQGNGPVRTATPGLADFAGAASPQAWQSPMARPFIDAAAAPSKSDGGLVPGQSYPIPGNPNYQFVALSGASGTALPLKSEARTPSDAPQVYDLPGGRQGYYDTDGSFKTFAPENQKFPAAVEAQLAGIYQQLGSTMAQLADPELSKRDRIDAEKRQKRYVAQIEQITKGFTPTTKPKAEAAPGNNPNDPLGLFQ